MKSLHSDNANLMQSDSHRIDQASLAALPRSPGVYIFKGEGTLPLYIGKSVDIRTRVHSHLRARDEVRMIAQSRKVEFIETAGEIGALLLEARLIKQQSPLFNIRLRRLRNLCSIQLSKHSDFSVTPEIVSGHDVCPGEAENLYGLFCSVHAAQKKLRELAGTHQLCLGLIGLEKISKRGCFGLQIKTCLGACVGQEDRSEHDLRLLNALDALRVHAWPYRGAVDLIEQQGDWIQKHRVQNWRYLGSWCSKTNQRTQFEQHEFDLDTYKILVKPVMLGTVRIDQI